MKYTECSKIVKKKAFERAIACDEQTKKPISETINLDTISKHFFLDVVYQLQIYLFQFLHFLDCDL